MSLAKKLKMIVKGERKPTFGTDPNEPWSVRAGITESESSMLGSYLKSRGINPEFVSKDTKISHAKSSEFSKWKRDHMFDDPADTVSSVARERMKSQREEVEFVEEKEQLDELSPGTLSSYVLKTTSKDPKRAEPRKKAMSKLAKIMAKRPVDPKAPRYLPMGEAKTIQGTALDKFRQAAAERARKHDDIEREMKARHAAGKEDMKGSIDRLEKQLSKEETVVEGETTKTKTGLIHRGTYGTEYTGRGVEDSTQKDSKDLTHLNKQRTKNLEKGMDVHFSKIKEESGASKETETKFHKKLDKLVHSTFGKRKDEMKKEEVEQIDELTKSDYISAVRKTKDPNFSDDESGPGYKDGRERIINRAEKHQGKRFADRLRKDNYWREFGLHKGVRKGMKKIGNDGKSHSITKNTYKEDVYQDSQAATQTAFDMGTTPNQTEPTHSRKKEMSKSARIIKSLYKYNNMKEEIYDHEKEDKSVATYGKKPKVEKVGIDGDEDNQAAMVLKGGKTLTGQERDTLEIDPIMRKPTSPEIKNSNKKTDK